MYRERCSTTKWRVDILRLHNECAATTSRAHSKSIHIDYAAGRRIDILRWQNGRVAATCRVHTKAMKVLNGDYMLRSVYSPNVRMNYGTMVNGVPAEVSHDDYRVAVVYEGYGAITSGTMVRWSLSCSSLPELWHDFQWSYGTMIINFRWLAGSYCTIKCILKYKLSLTNTILLPAGLVQHNLPNGNSTKPKSLHSPNRNSTLQWQIHFLRQTVTPRYKAKFTSFPKLTETVLSNLTGNSPPGAVPSTVN
jgi:hypothetical protein